MTRLLVSLALVAGTITAAWWVTPHHAPRKVCAVTLWADGHWTTAALSDSDALHYPCEVKP